MSKYPRLTNPPITEALIDIRTQLPDEINLETLLELHAHIKNVFPEKQERISFEATFQIPQTGPSSATHSSAKKGYLFKSQENNKVVQFRLDGFTFNKLKPYHSWEKIRDEAFALWSLYIKYANPVKVTRIALRYINIIDIPLPIKDFKDYILTIPEIAPKLPQELPKFFMQLHIPNHEAQAVAIITETIMPLTPAEKLPLIFDIDVSKLVEYEHNYDAIWEDFEKIRDYKNHLFFNSLTDATLRLFE